jgi:hypothetical protein
VKKAILGGLFGYLIFFQALTDTSLTFDPITEVAFFKEVFLVDLRFV